MKKGDYIDLCFVSYYPADIKKNFFVAPPWTTKTGDTVKLDDGSAGTVIMTRTVGYQSEDYNDFLKVSGTADPPRRLQGIIEYKKFDWDAFDVPEEAVAG